MKLRSALSLMLLASGILFLSGCVRYEESVVLDENGKGSVTILLSRPKRNIVDKVRARWGDFDSRFDEAEMQKDLPSGVTCQRTQTEGNERVEVKAVYTFDDINKLIGWASKTKSPLNGISVTRSGDTLEFTRRFQQPDKEAMENIQKFGVDVPVVFKVTGPGKISVQNGTKTEGNTVVWEYKAPELFANGGKTLSAQFSFGIPIWVFALAGFFLVDAIVVAVVLMKKKPVASANSNPVTK